MKSKIILIIFLFNLITYQIIGQCNCDAALSSDLLTVSTEYKESEFREFLYQYFKSSKKERKKMKRNYSGSFGLKVIIKKLPLEFSSSNSSSRDSQDFYAFEQEVINNNSVSNTILQSITTRYLSDNQLNAYKACLNACPNSKNGVTFTYGGDEFDVFFVRLTFNGVVGGSKVKLSSDVQYSGCTPVYGLVMKKDDEVENGQDLVQYFKRTSEDIIATISIRLEGIRVKPITLGKKGYNSTLPIGTIVSSTLTFSEFQSQITDKAFEKNTSIWAPCDGRDVIGSIYSTKYTKDFVPDLRGQFLRGNYTMGGPSESEQNTPNGKNPRTGEKITNGYIYQTDSFISHDHTIDSKHNGFHQNGSTRSHATGGGQNFSSSQTTSKSGEKETRPKNMYIYYYIKIN